MAADPGSSTAQDARTIRDFGDQWRHHGNNEGFYGSLELLADALEPLLDLGELRGRRVADIGSGTGRIVHMLLEAGAERVIAVEPSGGVELLRESTRDAGARVEVIHATGDLLPAGLDLDFVLSIGVVPFVPDPMPLLRAARAALRPGGRIVLWVYAAEAPRTYLVPLNVLRVVTTRLPHALLSGLCSVLNVALGLYIAACRILPLPLHEYMRSILSRLAWDKRKLTIYDQLNPSYVKFYRRSELEKLLEDGGFRDVRIRDRHGYSWTAVAARGPEEVG
jgi:SAM-dependent methyltransferase